MHDDSGQLVPLMRAIRKAVHERIGRGYSGMPDDEDMPEVRRKAGQYGDLRAALAETCSCNTPDCPYDVAIEAARKAYFEEE